MKQNKANAWRYLMELNRSADAVMMEGSMPEGLELEEGLAVRVDLVHGQGRPRAMPGSLGWFAGPLAAVVSQFTTPESSTVIESALLRD